jgi:hypothetical protein
MYSTKEEVFLIANMAASIYDIKSNLHHADELDYAVNVAEDLYATVKKRAEEEQ